MRFFVFGILLLTPFLTLAQTFNSYCVDLKVALLRKEPKLDSKTIAELGKYTPVKPTGKKEGRFIEVVTQSGRKGWVRLGEVSKDYQCVSVAVNKSRLRKGPGDDFPKDVVAQRGDGFLDLGGEDGWTKVERADGSSAWIRLEHTWKPRSKLRMSFDDK
jgi:SH3-like domain-containing protein